MRKQGKSKTSPWLILLVVAVVVVGLFASGVLNKVDGNNVPTVGGVVNCGDNPAYIDNATFNEYARGTGVAVTMYYTIEGSTDGARTLTPGSAGTTFNVGETINILSSASGYLDRVDSFTIKNCGANRFTNYIYGADGGTIDILDQNYNAVTDGVVVGNAVNLSDGGSANPLNAIIRIDGVVDESTGQLLITVEANDTEVDDISISAKSAGAKVIDGDYPTGDLNLFVAEGTAPSLKKAFVVDEILDGGQADYNIKFTPESGVTMGGGDATGFVYVNAYAGQWFVDTDGTFKFGWEDADGTAKYETAFADHDALIS